MRDGMRRRLKTVALIRRNSNALGGTRADESLRSISAFGLHRAGIRVRHAARRWSAHAHRHVVREARLSAA